MRTYNTITAIVFGLLTIALLWAGFYNTFHFASAACSAALTILALFDDTDGESIIDQLKKH